MRVIKIVILCSFAISCSQKQPSNDEQLAVIAAVYERIPKAIPPPPSSFEHVGEEANDIDYSKLKPLIFKYAINESFVDYDFDYVNGMSNKFQVYRSKELFEEKVLEVSYMQLVAGLSKFKKIEKIDTSKLDMLIAEDLVFWDRQTITKDEQRENDITGVISFSKVSFNPDFTIAAVVVGDYFEHIGNGIALYILEKIDNRWVIKYTQTLMMS